MAEDKAHQMVLAVVRQRLGHSANQNRSEANVRLDRADHANVFFERRSASRVFIAPPWPGIYEQDTERKRTLAEAEATYHARVDVYSAFGHELVVLSLLPVAERAACLISHPLRKHGYAWPGRER